MSEHHTFENSEEHEDQPKHETHVPAVVFLVLITAVAAASVAVYRPPTYPAPDQIINQQTDEDNREAVSYTPAESVDGLDDMPSGLLLGNSEVLSNRKLDIGSRQQRVVAFNTERSLKEVSQQYRQWIEAGNYTLENVSIGQGSQSITASNGSDELIIMLNGNEGSQSRVQLSYIKSSN
jgi:hypothetical protein